jgi:hypothetical protein
MLWITGTSFAVSIDTCCIINTIDYKEKLKTTQQIISIKYPNLQKKVDNSIYQIVRIVNKNPKYNSYNNKLKIYSTIINRVVDYVYNHNIQVWTPVYTMLSYFAYRIQDMYEYTKNTKKYNLESMIDNINKNPYQY